MRNKIIYLLLVCFAFVTAGKAQQLKVTGSNPAWEGSSEKYIVDFDGRVPAGLNLQFAVVNGTIISSNTNPYNGTPVNVIVRWNCGATAGNIRLTNANPAILFNYPVSLLSFNSYPDFCNAAEPAEQRLIYGQPPVVLTVSNCSPYCYGTYNFRYQWQEAAVNYSIIPWQPGAWTDIPGASAADYNAPAPVVYGVKAYRRVTSFFYNGSWQIIYSKPAYTSFLDFLEAGSLNGGHYITYNTQPVITQNPATGGQCYPADYGYTWERSLENGPWEIIGTGIDYPQNMPITGDCAIRRKVSCGGEDTYTTPILFKIIYNSPNTENLNYVRTNTINVPGVRSWPQADQLPTGDKVQSTTYLDAFGRPVQEVNKQVSLANSTANPLNINSYQDGVQHIEYDGLGRSTKGYLPFASASMPGFYKSNAVTEQTDFVNAVSGEPQNNLYTFTSNVFDGSPVNKVLNKKQAGWEWNTNPQNKGFSNTYDVNRQAEGVRIWTMSNQPGVVPVSNAGDVYPDNTLIKNIITDQRGKQTIEYRDLSGNIVLRKIQEKDIAAGLNLNGHEGWLCTYYVYDDFNKIRYVVTPKAVAEMDAAANWMVTPAIKEGLSFYYEYDKRGRNIVKHTPDAGEVHFVYDSRDRLVLTQDENQRNRSPLPQWSFSLYDEQDRPVITGLLNDSRNRAAMAAFTAGLTQGNVTAALYTGGANGADETFTIYNPVAGKMPGGNQYCGTCGNVTVNKITYYDGYTSSSRQFEPLTAADFAPSNNPYKQLFQKTARTEGMVTGSKTRLLDDKYDNGIVTDDAFLTNTSYYDERGDLLENLQDNIRKGTDVTAMQYDFMGKILSTHSKHRSAAGLYNNFITVTKTDVDLLHRPLKTYTLYTGSSAAISNTAQYKLLSEVQYDALGRVKTKKVGTDPTPTRAGQPMEVQDYNYNIQGWLTGINKDYALAQYIGTPGYDQWSRRLGLYLGYDNRDGKFTNVQPQYGGNISGTVWRSQGDNTPRKYEYTYDNANRFVNAAFRQIDGFGGGNTNWSNATADFTAGVSGYDENGNITGMKQTGILPGFTGGLLMDDLQYSYFASSNRLQAISDAGFGGSTAYNGKLGDFKDETGTQDYDYDRNGNLVYDKNKGIIENNSTPAAPQPGVAYNYLDLPQLLQVKGRGMVAYTYDAAGNKLAKKVTDLATGMVNTIYYAGNYVYKNNDLQYILHPEGKLRLTEPVTGWVSGNGASGKVHYRDIQGNVAMAGSQWGVWDYFVKDNLGNVRLVLTEQYFLQQLNCSMEDSGPNNPAQEEADAFGQPGSNNEVSITRIPTNQTPWAANKSDYVSKLRKQPGGTMPQTSIGPNVLLKVMAGDELSGKAAYFYENLNGTTSNHHNIVNDIAGGLLGAFGNSGSNALIKQNQGAISSMLTLPGGALDNFTSSQPPQPGTTPKAYMNCLFFDEQLRFAGGKAIPVDDLAAGSTSRSEPMAFSTTAPKNGYVYIYLSNESTNIPVYFDDFTVRHLRGVITEDNAYYPQGLPMSGICAKAAGAQQNGYRYSGIEFADEFDLNIGETLYRSYDPQTGRWWQPDPMVEGMENWSPFVSNYANPIIFTDPLGDWPNWGKIWDGIKQGASVGYHFVAGVGKGVVNTVVGVGNMILHPIETVKNLYNAVTHPRKLLNALDKQWQKFKAADANGKAEMLGELTGSIITPIAAGRVFTSLGGMAAVTNGAMWVENGIRKVASMMVGDVQVASKLEAGAAAGEAATAASETAAAASEGVAAAGKTGAVAENTAAGATQALDGSFSITEAGWRGYPAGAPKPGGPFRLISGKEYADALKLKNAANKALHNEFPSLKGYDLHELQPVKFGGSPTSIFNKMPLNPSYHRQFTSFWRTIQNNTGPFTLQ